MAETRIEMIALEFVEYLSADCYMKNSRYKQDGDICVILIKPTKNGKEEKWWV